MANLSEVTTRFFIISDTHGQALPQQCLPPKGTVDVAIHCGDLTDGSGVEEYQNAIELLRRINAPLEIMIAGNHDLVLDPHIFQRKLVEAHLDRDDPSVRKKYGAIEEVRNLLLTARSEGIYYLEKGTQEFVLGNGARLKVYTDPRTPSASDWAFEYNPTDDHNQIWHIEENTDVVITHGPPHGIFDRTESAGRVGSSSLFSAIAKARPKMHCFGHVHSGWGAKVVAWKDNLDSNAKCDHFRAIDNEKSDVIETLGSLLRHKFDSDEVVLEKEERLKALHQIGTR